MQAVQVLLFSGFRSVYSNRYIKWISLVVTQVPNQNHIPAQGEYTSKKVFSSEVHQQCSKQHPSRTLMLNKKWRSHIKFANKYTLRMIWWGEELQIAKCSDHKSCKRCLCNS
jgi:hypothetical protein